MPDVGFGIVDVRTYTDFSTYADINKVKMELERVQRHNTSLQRKLDKLVKKHQTTCKERIRKLRNLRSLRHERTVVKKYLQQRLSDCQVHKIMYPQRASQRGYTTQDVSFALVIRSISVEAYDYLRKVY